MYSQIPAFALGALAAASVITTTFWNQWSVSGPTSKGVLGPIWAWRSLFGECMQYQGGQSQCQGQNSMFLMSGYKVAIRGLMITSIILSTLGCIGVLLGMQCTKVFQERRNFKRKLMFGNGICFLLSGIFTFTAVMWYTLVVYDEFFKFENQDNYIQWELGACVYLGYIASVICVLAFLACICRPGKPAEDEEETSKSKSYYYKPRLYKSSRDDEQIRGLLDRYRSRYSRKRSSNHSSSKKPSKRRSSSKHSSSRKYDRRDSGHKHLLSSARSSRSSSLNSASDVAQCVEIASSVDTYRYSAYV